MDISTLAGLGLAMAAIVLGAISDIGSLVDIPSFFITVVGSIGGMFIANPKDVSFKFFSAIMKGIQEPTIDTVETLKTLYSFAEKARREGLISLEADLENLDNEFMKDGLRAAVDGTDPEEIRKILEIKMELFEEEEGKWSGVLNTWGSLAPAYGMIGTLIGLILMLKTLNDPTTIGPKMAIALITTLYGAFVANIFTIPIAEKIGRRTKLQVNMLRMITEGILSIVSGENPRLMEEKLKAFLSPADKQKYESEKEG
ncbi:chemotaxis protein MotA [Marinitoga hydrogenitolerans DSM 16785]|uniref:Chemotaxis protein MotA n=1 Tax=Marinitoga hydrogenitolerans (strain DSM 16785 / JCM 12826 / AT1271) TaxID=1122195 RepID=A0A1M4XEW3_MARH1|nr:motility protein A [Marinitoga hydrogenitolerans]SHE91836.1 chemotaxis protein MotA [Marinitoga hydrogenitolerans DSM 16785]